MARNRTLVPLARHGFGKGRRAPPSGAPSFCAFALQTVYAARQNLRFCWCSCFASRTDCLRRPGRIAPGPAPARCLDARRRNQPISEGGRKVGEFTGDIELSADVLHDGSGTERFRCVMAERKHRHSKLVGRMVHDVFKLSRDQQVGAGGGSAALTCERADFVAIR